MASTTPTPDRTETMQPRASSPAAPCDPDESREPELEGDGIDDPDRYEQIAEHARGGLGRIVRAVDKRLGRTVAVKQMLRRDAGDASEARFLREAMITARLEHPGIVPVHEAGRWPNGDPYYVMKLVEGRTLKALIAEHRTLRERLALLPHVIAVADAVGYAHSEGVIHRDLKPSNVVIGAFGETIVVDWGLARDLRVPIAPEAAALEQQVVGTPAYMSPEQARGGDGVVDERSDVYAIGAVLYELLAGAAPHADTTASEQVTPQIVIDRVLAGPPLPLRGIVPDVPLELVGIVDKAMARDPNLRYPHATTLAEDLRRFQTGKLVSAHSYTTWERVRRKLVAHRGVVAVATASVVALAGLGVMSVKRVVAEKNFAMAEGKRAENALQSAEARKHQLVILQAQTSLSRDPTAALAWLKLAVAQPQLSDSERGAIVDIADEADALGVASRVFRPGDWVFDAQFTRDGDTVIAAVRDGTLRSYDLPSGRERTLMHSQASVTALALTQDGATVLAGTATGELFAVPIAGGVARPIPTVPGRAITKITLASDSRRVLVVHEDEAHMNGAPEIDSLAGALPRVIAPAQSVSAKVAQNDWTHAIGQVAGNRVAAVAAGGATRALATTEKAIHNLAISPCGDVALIHDGVEVWQVPFAGGPMKPFAAYDGGLNGVVWSPDATTVALVGERPEVVLVDVATGATRVLRGHTDAIYGAEFTHDGRALLTAGDDGTARVWNLEDGSSSVLRGHDDDVYRARWAPDERHVVTASLDGSLRVWPIGPADGSRVFDERGAEHHVGPIRDERSNADYGGQIEAMKVTADGRVLAKTATEVASWSLATGARQSLFAWGAGGDAHSLGVGQAAPTGDSVALVNADNSIELRRKDQPTLTLRGHTGLITHLEYGKDGQRLYTASSDGSVRRWDVATGAPTVLLAGDTPVRGFAVARDGRVAVQTGDSNAILIPADGSAPRLIGSGPKWCAMYANFEAVRDRLVLHRCDHSVAIVDNDRVIELPTSGYPVVGTAISPDGNLIAGALSDRTVRIWTSDGKLVDTLRGHSDLVMDVAFSPDGRELASASYDKTVRVWDLASGRHRVLRGHTGAINRLAWPTADTIVTGSRDGTIRTWRIGSLDLPDASQLAERLGAATSATIDGMDRPTSTP